MRSLAALFLVFWWGGVCLASQESRGRMAAITFGGQEYVELQRWAELKHFRVAVAKSDKDEDVQLTNLGTAVHFKANSQRAEFNGIALFLCYPVVVRQGAAYIAQKDVERSLEPLLFPAKSEHRIKTIVLSAGHGGKDAGYQVANQQEKNLTLLLTKELDQQMRRAGLKTVLIRNSDKLVEYEDRARIAKRSKADLYVELHYNSAGAISTESRGVEVYCLTPAGANSTNGGSDHYGEFLPGNRHDDRNILLAYQIHRHLVERAGLADRGVRRARFVVLREAEMPAVLIEAGFMSHPEELRQVEDPVRRRHTAQAILEGVMAYKRLVEHSGTK